MDQLRQAQEKLLSCRSLLREIKSSEFPHRDSKDALDILDAYLSNEIELINTAKDSSVGRFDSPLTSRSTSTVAMLLEVIGLIVNSASIWNSFEVHGPLLHIAQRLIGQEAKLLLSFEWNYVPFTYPQNIPSLPNFVVIGLPASESTNALILPAAGHELGHSAWRTENFWGSFETKSQTLIINQIENNYWNVFNNYFPTISKSDIGDVLGKEAWGKSFDWVCSQVEEVACDVFGLFIFGISYLECFEYLLAPGSRDRVATYPSLKRRAEFLEECASKLDLVGGKNFDQKFIQSRNPYPKNDWMGTMLDIADFVTAELSDEIFDKVITYCKQKGIRVPVKENWEGICTDFYNLVPAGKAKGLPEILNAGWELYKRDDFLNEKDIPGKRRRIEAINELVLKSIEVFEIQMMTGTSDGT